MVARTRGWLAYFLLAFGTVLFTGRAFALGLGEITLNSSLNQALDASIELLQLEGLSAEEIQVTLGSDDDFARANIDRPSYLEDISFQVVVQSRDTGVLRLRSSKPIAEPFMNFLINAQWPGGRLLREYTILMDLPTFSENEESGTAPVNAARVEETSTAPSQNQTQGQAPSPMTVSPEGTLTTQANDTLWRIASETRPDSSVSIQQMMIAIQGANPEAFINGNINLLKVNEVLRIPGLNEVLALNRQQAAAQVARQNQDVDSEPLMAASSSAPGAAPASNGDELRVLTEGTEEAGSDGDIDARIQALENALALNEENLDRARLENTELNTRLSDLESQIATLQDIISIEDQRLAQLQAQIAAEAEARVQAAAEQAAQPQPAPQQIASAPVSSQTPSLMDRAQALMNNPIAQISALVVLILLALAFLVWRQNRGDEDDDDFQPKEEALEEEEALADSSENDAEQTDDNLDFGGDLATGAAMTAADNLDWENEAESVDNIFDENDSGLEEDEEDIESGTSELDTSADEDEQDDEDVFLAEADAELSQEEGESVEADVAEEPLEEPEEDDFNLAAPVEEEATDTSGTESPEEEGAEDMDGDALAETAEEEGEDDTEPEESFDLDSAMEAVSAEEEEAEESPSDEMTATEEEAEAEDMDFQLDDEVVEETSAEEDLAFALSDEDSGQPEDGAEPETVEEDNEISFGLQEEESPDQEDSGAEDFNVDFDLGTEEGGADEDDSTPILSEDEEIDLGDLSAELGTFEADADADAESEEDGSEEESTDSLELGDIDLEAEDLLGEDEDFDGLSDVEGDEVATKLDLAVAYEAMGDLDGAKEILGEVLEEGNEDQKAEAQRLLKEWGGA